MKTLEEQIAIMTAYKNGAKIECHYFRSSPEHWAEPTTAVIWDWANFDFRIAEPARKAREISLLVWPNGKFALDTTGGWLPSGLCFDSPQFSGCEPVLFREVVSAPPLADLVKIVVRVTGSLMGPHIYIAGSSVPAGRKLVVGETIDFVEVPK